MGIRFLPLILVCFTMCNTAVKAPAKVPSIPQNAVWSGGLDGGKWYLVVKVNSDNSIRIKVYDDYTGEVNMDTDFVINSYCKDIVIDSSFVVKNINGFDGKHILLTALKSSKNCFLEPK